MYGEVRAACLRAAAFDEERGDQAPVRVLVELGDAELAARQPIDRSGGERRRRREAQDVELVDIALDGHEVGWRAISRHLPRASSREDNVLYPLCDGKGRLG